MNFKDMQPPSEYADCIALMNKYRELGLTDFEIMVKYKLYKHRSSAIFMWMVDLTNDQREYLKLL